MKNLGHAREMCSALEYDGKTSKIANIIRGHCSPENITQKYQMRSVHTVCTLISWPKDSQKYDIYWCMSENKKRDTEQLWG